MKKYLSVTKPTTFFTWLMAVSGLGSILLCSLIATGHLLLTPWRDLYLFNADSLTLALFAKSLLSGEALSWKFSSQIFFFPELFLYIFCYVLTPSIEWSFIANSFVNLWLWVALTYLLARAIGLTRLNGLLVAVISAAWIAFCVVLEPQPYVNVTALVTLILFNTYYFGAVLTTIAVALLTCLLINDEPRDRSKAAIRKILILSLAVVLSALTYFSNPMFLLQCSIPFLVTLGLFRFLSKITKEFFYLLALTQCLALGLGQALRYIFREHIGRSTNRYIHLKSFVEGIDGVLENLRLAFSTFHSALEYACVGTLLLLSGWVALNLFKDALRDARLKQALACSSSQFCLLFLSLSAWLTLLGTIVSGNFLMRYFLPVGLFPLLVVVYFCSKRYARLGSRFKLLLLPLMLCTPVILWSISNAIETNSASFAWLTQWRGVEHYEPVQCFNRHMKKEHFNAVGSFWTSRALDGYGSPSSRVLQVSETLEPVHWLTNRANFQSIKINGVIVNRKGPDRAKVSGNIYQDDVVALGAPANIFRCNDFDIYFYPDDSEGFKTLSRLVRRS
jgi:hypothetical protein